MLSKISILAFFLCMNASMARIRTYILSDLHKEERLQAEETADDTGSKFVSLL
jgi:hypothetical protein